MGGQQGQQQSDPVVAAIERVLRVERDGTQQLQDGQQHARTLLSEARADAAAIATRADARISKLHSAYLLKVQRDIERLEQPNLSSGEHAGGAYDCLRLARAARRVAAKLTGGA